MIDSFALLHARLVRETKFSLLCSLHSVQYVQKKKVLPSAVNTSLATPSSLYRHPETSMNAPDKFLTWRFEDEDEEEAEGKLVYTVDQKIPNAGTFVLK